MSASNTPRNTPRTLTGRAVLLWFCGLFAVMFAVNGYMVHAALSTFGGREPGNAYELGQKFGVTNAAADAQDERGWRVSATLRPDRTGTSVLVEALDATGRPIDGLAGRLRFVHLADGRRDVTMEADAVGAGRYKAAGSVPAGTYHLTIDLHRGADRLFRSVNRVTVREEGERRG